MKLSVFILVLFCALFHSYGVQPPVDHPDILVRVRVSSADDLRQLVSLGLQMEYDMAVNNTAEGFISESDLEKVGNAGFEVTVIRDGLAKQERGQGAVSYYTWERVVSTIEGWHDDYPEITGLDSVGHSMGGMPIWEFRISSAPDTAPRQRYYLNGSTHGNEWMGTEVCMWIADYLLKNYESNDEVTAMVDRSEFVFHPVMNPDGFTSGTQGRRTLNNGRDPNRSFGWQVGGTSGSRPYEWPESRNYRDVMLRGPVYMNMDFHTGLVQLMRPFFGATGEDLDRNEYSALSRLYPIPGMIYGQAKERAIFMSAGGGSHGIACDAAFGTCGSMAFLPELCEHYRPASEIPTIAEYGRTCIFKIIDEMQKGVKGRVFDKSTGERLFARVQVTGDYAAVFSHPETGAYFKYLSSPSGSVEVTAFANGYTPLTARVDAVSGGFAGLDFPLEADPELPYGALWINAIQTFGGMDHSEVLNCLQLSDGETVGLQGGNDPLGFVSLYFGPRIYITDQDGDDITVHTANNTAYEVMAAWDVDDLEGDGFSLGTASGTSSFDLSDIGLDSARFVEIAVRQGTLELDAVEAVPGDFIVASAPRGAAARQRDRIRVISGSGGAFLVQARLAEGKFDVSLYDMAGRLVRTLGNGHAATDGNRTFTIRGDKAQQSSGTYIVRISDAFGVRTSRGTMFR
jgi:hypothetical protein